MSVTMKANSEKMKMKKSYRPYNFSVFSHPALLSVSPGGFLGKLFATTTKFFWIFHPPYQKGKEAIRCILCVLAGKCRHFWMLLQMLLMIHMIFCKDRPTFLLRKNKPQSKEKVSSIHPRGINKQKSCCFRYSADLWYLDYLN